MQVLQTLANVAKALDITERTVLRSIELCAQLQKNQAQKVDEEKRKTLERAGTTGLAERGASSSRNDNDNDDEAAERDQLRQERHRERQCERNLARATPDIKKYASLSFLPIRLSTPHTVVCIIGPYVRRWNGN